MKIALAAALALAAVAAALAFGFIAAAPAAERPQTFVLPLDSGTTSLTVEVSGKGRICGPARVVDNTGRVLMALGAGHCVSTASGGGGQ